MRCIQLNAHHSIISITLYPLIALLFQRSFEMVVAMLAIQKAGFGDVPIDPKCPATRAIEMLQDTACSLLLCDRTLVVTATALANLGSRVQLMIFNNACLLTGDAPLEVAFLLSPLCQTLGLR